MPDSVIGMDGKKMSRLQLTKALDDTSLQKETENDGANKILLGSTPEELGGGIEAHSREKDFENRLGQRIRENEGELQRPLTQHEREDIERQLAFDYAKENTMWVDNLFSLGEPTQISGNENTLALDKKNGIVYKANNLSNSNNSITDFVNQTKYGLAGCNVAR